MSWRAAPVPILLGMLWWCVKRRDFEASTVTRVVQIDSFKYSTRFWFLLESNRFFFDFGSSQMKKYRHDKSMACSFFMLKYPEIGTFLLFAKHVVENLLLSQPSVSKMGKLSDLNARTLELSLHICRWQAFSLQGTLSRRRRYVRLAYTAPTGQLNAYSGHVKRWYFKTWIIPLHQKLFWHSKIACERP